MCVFVSSLQRSVTRTQCWATRTRGGSMTWWEVRSPAARVTLTGGASTSTGASRPTSPPRTSSTCSSEVASPPVSEPLWSLFIISGDSRWRHVGRFNVAPLVLSESAHLQQRQDELQPRDGLPTREDRRQRRRTDPHPPFTVFCCLVRVRCRRSRLTLVFPPGWLLHVHPADAHRGPDSSVHTEPDDGVAPSLQPLLQTVSTHTHTRTTFILPVRVVHPHNTHTHTLHVCVQN